MYSRAGHLRELLRLVVVGGRDAEHPFAFLCSKGDAAGHPAGAYDEDIPMIEGTILGTFAPRDFSRTRSTLFQTVL